MGLGGAMNSGVSGLQAFSNAMSAIGNNLANANTAGFKASRTLFADLIPDTVNGSGGPSQIGRGAGLSTVDNIFTQGSIESTSSSLDLAIEGTGFFIVRTPDSQANNYTRAGSFRLDESGYLTNPEGYIVQGYQSRESGGFQDLISDVQINTRSSVPGQASTEVGLTTNLNAQAAENPGGGWDLDDPTATSNFATTSEVYDSLGNTHLITTYFTKTGTNAWDYHQTLATEEVTSSSGGLRSTDGTIVEIADGTLGFNDNGILDSLNGSTIDPAGSGEVTVPAANLDWENTENLPSEDLTYEMNVTQFATDSKVVTQQANGYSSGYLTDISVDSEGVITGTYSNGESRGLAKIALGKFANNNGLEKLGKNLFRATNASGPADVGTPGSGLGNIFANSLEQSTVDIAEEFTKMITTQRAFQANSKTITTTDEMLSQVINMKR